MKAIALEPGTTHIEVVERQEPQIQADDDVKLQVLEVGICGTDREEAAGGRADAPKGEHDLIIGHEMLARVVEVGSKVTNLSPGDLAVVTVRRGCGQCQACELGRADMCYTGLYTERGIKERNGFQTEFVIDKPQFIIKVPEEIRSFAVLTEPTTVIEKAIDEAARLQVARLPGACEPEEWLQGKRVLVAGLGPVGLLAAMVLRLRGAEVWGLDIVAPDTIRPQILEKMGGSYLNGREVDGAHIAGQCGQIDLIVEATGIASLEFDLLSALGVNGVYVVTGVPGESRAISIDGATLMRKLVLKNQVMVGSVNASPTHFQMAVADLQAAGQRWGSLIEQMITSRAPYSDIKEVLSTHSADEIKAVIEWS